MYYNQSEREHLALIIEAMLEKKGMFSSLYLQQLSSGSHFCMLFHNQILLLDCDQQESL